MAELINFTKQLIANIQPTQGKRLYCYDQRVKGLGLSVTQNGIKSFFVYRRVSGQPKRITLGRFPDLSIEQARKEAQKVLGKIAVGINPIAEKRTTKLRSATLSEVFDHYLKARKSLKPITLKDYKRIMQEVFGDWLNKPLIEITKDMVARRHTEFGKRSEARANNAMRVLRALFNFASGEYEDSSGHTLFPDNPVKRLSHTRAWYRIERRQSIVRLCDLPAWYSAVMSLANDTHNSKAATIRDYLLLILFTGLRRQEAAKLTWSQINFEDKYLTIVDTKNRQPHTLPLSDYIYHLLRNRRWLTKSPFVFAGSGNAGHLIEPKKQMEKIKATSGVDFTLHDLRRTFITIAESLDIPAYALKKLLNHKTNADVTAGYLVISVDRLKEPMQKISERILCIVTADVVSQLEAG